MRRAMPNQLPVSRALHTVTASTMILAIHLTLLRTRRATKSSIAIRAKVARMTKIVVRFVSRCMSTVRTPVLSAFPLPNVSLASLYQSIDARPFLVATAFFQAHVARP